MGLVALRALLLVAGVAVMVIGLNVGLGGIRTLGLQVSADFVAVSDATGFAVQDSHTRFLGGLFFAVGAVLLAGTFALRRLRGVLIVLCAIMPVAGLFRLTGAGAAATVMPSLLASLAFEFVLFPALAVTLWRLPAQHEPTS